MARRNPVPRFIDDGTARGQRRASGAKAQSSFGVGGMAEAVPSRTNLHTTSVRRVAEANA
jgi:hypothetical protein